MVFAAGLQTRLGSAALKPSKKPTWVGHEKVRGKKRNDLKSSECIERRSQKETLELGGAGGGGDLFFSCVIVSPHLSMVVVDLWVSGVS